MTEGKIKWIANEGENVKIVVLDSGVRSSHPKLVQYKINGYNIINDSLDIEDHLGHGTAVIGIIKQHVPKAEIFSIKLFDYDYTVDFADLCRALEYIDKNVDFNILNLSVGITECPDHELLERLCHSLSQKGIVIAAFDNFGAISYPAAYPCVIGVDGDPKYLKPFEYDFIEGGAINVRAKGGNQRLLWNDPDYIIQSGSSFACAHITGLVAKIVQGKTPDLDEVKETLCKYAANVLRAKQCVDNHPLFKIKKAICFPYNKEIDTLCRNESLLSFELVGMYDSKYNFNLGKVTCTGKTIKNVELINWDDDFDTVILGHVAELNNMVKIDYGRYIIDLCVKHKKNLFQFDNNGQTGDKMYTPNVRPEHIPSLNYGKLYMIGKPVIAVLGTSSCQGKFSLQLAMRKKFSLLGYRVGQVGTEPQSWLFGLDETFHCGYGANLFLDGQTAIGYINYLLHKVEMKNPDIIIVGGQSGLIPYAMYNLEHHSLYQQELLLASNPDVIILCINYFDDIEYIRRTVEYAEILTESKVAALFMFPFEKDFSWSAVSSNLRLVEAELLESHRQVIEKEIGVRVFLQSQADQLCEEVINYLSEGEDIC